MTIAVLCVGKIKESYLKDAVRDYAARIGRYASLQITEVADEPAAERLSDLQKLKIKEKEGERLLGKSKDGSYRIALCIDGKRMDSIRFSQHLDDCMLRGYSRIEFLIGGSLGLSDEAVRSADLRLSFSDMTFPHQLMRVILLEQIYRAFRIRNNEPYHK